MNPRVVLEQLGLNQKEIQIYSYLLELGEVTVPPIAQKTGIKRQTAYAVLHALESKGFVSKTIRGKKMIFSAQHPKKLLAQAEIRLKELQQTLPQLESMMSGGQKRPRVVIYEGKSALDRAWDDAFVAKGEILYMGNIALAQEVFARTMQKLLYVNFSTQFRTRELLDESPESKTYAEKSAGKFREIRFVPREFLPFQTDLGVFGDTVLITSIKDEYFSIKIESAEIAHAHRSLFEAMWRISSE